MRTIQSGRRSVREREIPHAARRLGLPGRLARWRNREGLDLIAAAVRCGAGVLMDATIPPLPRAVMDYIVAFDLAATREAIHSNGVSVRMRFQMSRSHPSYGGMRLGGIVGNRHPQLSPRAGK
jgi:hypothetical protein